MLELLNEQKGSQNIGPAEFKLCTENAITHNLYSVISKILDKTKLTNINTKATGIPIIFSLICVESKGDPTKVNKRYGATGLMQLTPPACETVQADYSKMNEINENITAGIKLINHFIEKFRLPKTNAIIKKKYLDADFPGRISWIMLAYNNGFGGATEFARSGKNIADTLFYNDFKVYHDYWSNFENLKKIMKPEDILELTNEINATKAAAAAAAAEAAKKAVKPVAKSAAKSAVKSTTKPAAKSTAKSATKSKGKIKSKNEALEFTKALINNQNINANSLLEFNNKLVSVEFIKKTILLKLLNNL